jgi:hypothetical protein
MGILLLSKETINVSLRISKWFPPVEFTTCRVILLGS